MKYFNLLQQMLIETTSKSSDKIALICEGQTYTFAEIYNRSWMMANLLKSHGAKRGDRVVIQAGNSLLSVVSFWGVLLADGIAIMASEELTPAKLAALIDDAKAKHYISNNLTESKLLQLDRKDGLHYILIAETVNLQAQFTKIKSFSMESSCSCVEFISRNHEQDLAAIVYTSGSSGEPKGVMLSHRNMLAATHSINQYLHYQSSDKILSALPISFDYGLYQMILAFSVGATLILEKNALFPARLLSIIDKQHVTVLPCVPTLINLLTKQAQYFNYHYHSLRIITNTGAALTLPLIKAVQACFPQSKLFSMYGLTECKRCTYLPYEDIHRKPESVGIPIANTEIWIVDDEGKRLPPNHVGQLVVRGATVMQGYWQKPEATAEKLKPGRLPGEKVLYTGDLGYIDTEGYFYFKGRKDDLLKIKGQKVSPAEIESILSRELGLQGLAVISMCYDDEDTLMMVIEGITDANIKQKLTKINQHLLLPCQRPSHIVYLANLPKSTNGKIDKIALKKLVQSQSLPERIA